MNHLSLEIKSDCVLCKTKIYILTNQEFFKQVRKFKYLIPFSSNISFLKMLLLKIYFLI